MSKKKRNLRKELFLDRPTSHGGWPKGKSRGWVDDRPVNDIIYDYLEKMGLASNPDYARLSEAKIRKMIKESLTKQAKAKYILSESTINPLDIIKKHNMHWSVMTKQEPAAWNSELSQYAEMLYNGLYEEFISLFYNEESNNYAAMFTKLLLDTDWAQGDKVFSNFLHPTNQFVNDGEKFCKILMAYMNYNSAAWLIEMHMTRLLTIIDSKCLQYYDQILMKDLQEIMAKILAKMNIGPDYGDPTSQALDGIGEAFGNYMDTYYLEHMTFIVEEGHCELVDDYSGQLEQEYGIVGACLEFDHSCECSKSPAGGFDLDDWVFYANSGSWNEYNQAMSISNTELDYSSYLNDLYASLIPMLEKYTTDMQNNHIKHFYKDASNFFEKNIRNVNYKSIPVHDIIKKHISEMWNTGGMSSTLNPTYLIE